MSAIIRYVAPHTECVNGLPRPEHHFFLEADYEEQQEIVDWLRCNCRPCQHWPEIVADHRNGWGAGREVFHVILHEDRHARLFRVRW